MRVALNLLYLLPGIVGGTETYATGLLSGLARMDRPNEYLVFTNREAAGWPIPAGKGFTRVVCPLSGSQRGGRYLFEQIVFPVLLRRYSADVVHSLGYVSPLVTPCPSVVTIHDLNYRAFGSSMAANRRLVLQFFVEQSARRAGQIIAVSEFSKREIQRELRIPGDRIAVIHEAAAVPSPQAGECADAEWRDRLGINRPYFLAFSSRTPNKNVPRLISAYKLAREKHCLPHQLVLVGHVPEQLRASRAPGGNSDGVILTGYLEKTLLQSVLAGAEALIFPSVYEGFGLPILEAMAAGVPVISSSSASLPEVAGDAAIYFDPYSVDDMVRKIVEVAVDPSLRAGLKRKGIANLGRFSWDRAARETEAVYERLVHGSPRA